MRNIRSPRAVPNRWQKVILRKYGLFTCNKISAIIDKCRPTHQDKDMQKNSHFDINWWIINSVADDDRRSRIIKKLHFMILNDANNIQISYGINALKVSLP